MLRLLLGRRRRAPSRRGVDDRRRRRRLLPGVGGAAVGEDAFGVLVAVIGVPSAAAVIKACVALEPFGNVMV